MARILIVDDDEVSRLLMGRVLQDAGHEVVYACDGEVAMERVRRQPFDVVVTDLAMPTMNGLRLIRDMREMHSDVPTIAISGQNAEQLLLAEDYGAAATLFKPIDREQLVSAVDEAARGSNGVWTQLWL
jgi:CheY-like chemotaxis protein